ncbi:MAG TPA: hypothetical protein VNB22_01720 [Pyrinomonadaceae bacterium]|jgi:hypothetical protein|nr:hypothetical protein [Pyrinomonadaceae bacterium]
MKILPIFVLPIVFSSISFAQSFLDKAGIIAPEISENALKSFRQITSGNQWASFGFIAAGAELNRR